jgi:sugar/nucleoside kinase (ribokinase family)
MKKYNVYGMGNALLDIEFDITPSFLNQQCIEKGLSTLVSEEEQQALIADLGFDNVRKIASGGSAANTMIALQHFGAQCFYSCKIANDKHGDLYYADMVAAKLDSNIKADSRIDGTTGTCLVLVTADSDRTMKSHLGISNGFSEAELNPVALLASEYLYIEGYLVTSDTAMDAILTAKELAKDHDVKIAITLSDPSLVKYFKPRFKQILISGIDLLFCNEEEALEYTGTHLIDAAQYALRDIAKQFVITRGAKGSLVFDGEALIEIPAYPAKPIDSVGAGDAYAGAFLYALTHGYSYKQAGHLASHTAAMIVSQYGPRVSVEQAEESKAAILVK